GRLGVEATSVRIGPGSFALLIQKGEGMAADEGGSITRWIEDMKEGDAAAAQPLWERYFERLAHLAHRRLQTSPPRGAGAQGEDAALSAFHSVCAGAARGQFPLLTDRDDLWRLLVVVTARKVAEQLRREGRLKRGGGKILGESRLQSQDPDDEVAGLDAIVGS